MTSEAYWQKRAEDLVLYGERGALEVLNHLEDVYAETTRGVLSEVAALYARYARDGKITLAEVRRRLTPAQLASAKRELDRYYREVRQEGKFDPSYIEALRAQYSRAYMSRLEESFSRTRHLIERLYAEQNVRLGEAMVTQYQHSYDHTAFDLMKFSGVGVPFETMGEAEAVKAINTPWLGERFSDRVWRDKDRLLRVLETAIPRGIAMGQSPERVGEYIRKEMGVSRSNAARIARTEIAHAVEQGRLDNYKTQGIKRYTYMATLDKRTSEVCQSLDGKTFAVTEAQTGINYPPMHPNCRSTTTPETSAWVKENGTRLANNGDGWYEVPASMTYEQWRDSLTSGEDSGKIGVQKEGERDGASTASGDSGLAAETGAKEPPHAGTGGVAGAGQRSGSDIREVGAGGSGGSAVSGFESGVAGYRIRDGVVITPIHEVPAAEHEARLRETIERAPVQFATVDLHTAAELQGARCYIGEGSNADGSSVGYYGSVVKPDGDITGVFNGDGIAGSRSVVLKALQEGGDRLDAYAVDNIHGVPGKLAHYYHKSGFIPVARVPFNPEYAAPGVAPSDIVFYRHNGDGIQTVIANYGRYAPPTPAQYDALPVMEYDEAMRYRDSFMR